MERITVLSNLGIGIFQGKKARYNKLILDVLYDKGPLRQWGISKQIRERARTDVYLHQDIEYARTQMIQSVVSRRLRSLERKEYVQKIEGGLWLLLFKGFIANIVIQSEHKAFGKEWIEWIPRAIQFLQQQPKQSYKYNSEDLKIKISSKRVERFLRRVEDDLTDFKKWGELANASRNLMKNGIINLDLISNKTLITVLLVEESGPENPSLTELLLQIE